MYPRSFINRRRFVMGASSVVACALAREVDARPTPPLMLAEVYDDVDPSGFWISEKYDGVRAYWDGAQLLTRAGNRIAAPDWFIAPLPREALDGELWRYLEERARVVPPPGRRW